MDLLSEAERRQGERITAALDDVHTQMCDRKAAGIASGVQKSAQWQKRWLKQHEEETAVAAERAEQALAAVRDMDAGEKKRQILRHLSDAVIGLYADHCQITEAAILRDRPTATPQRAAKLQYFGVLGEGEATTATWLAEALAAQEVPESTSCVSPHGSRHVKAVRKKVWPRVLLTSYEGVAGLAAAHTVVASPTLAQTRHKIETAFSLQEPGAVLLLTGVLDRSWPEALLIGGFVDAVVEAFSTFSLGTDQELELRHRDETLPEYLQCCLFVATCRDDDCLDEPIERQNLGAHLGSPVGKGIPESALYVPLLLDLQDDSRALAVEAAHHALSSDVHTVSMPCHPSGVHELYRDIDSAPADSHSKGDFVTMATSRILGVVVLSTKRERNRKGAFAVSPLEVGLLKYAPQGGWLPRASGRRFVGLGEADGEDVWQGDFYFVVAADTQFGFLDDPEWGGNGTGNWEEERIAAEMLVARVNAMEPPPKMMVICGDLVHSMPEGTDTKHTNPEFCKRQRDDFKRTFSQLRPEIPCVVIPGNHGVGNAPTPASIEGYTRDFGDDYFAYWAGGVRVIALNTQPFPDLLRSEVVHSCRLKPESAKLWVFDGSAFG